MSHFPDSYTRGARLLRQLRSIPPGKAMQITTHMLLDVEVPANPFDRQTPEFLVEWMYSRLPFQCTVTRDLPEPMTQSYTFYRPVAPLT